MKRVSITELKYKFRKIERMLQAGEEIQITKRNKVIAKMHPERENPQEKERPEMPDFLGRMRENVRRQSI